MGGNARQSVTIQGTLWKPVAVEFSEPEQSTEGGLVILRTVDQRLGLTAAMSSSLRDNRQLGKMRHTTADLLRQRVFSIAAGYADANDARQLADDPMLKLVCGRSPEDPALGSQPTLSRFENRASAVDLLRMSYAMADAVIRAQQKRRGKKRVRRIMIDLDGVEDPTYGNQQLTFFNAFYDNWCYIPLVASVQFDDDPQQFVVNAMLRTGRATGDVGAVAVLQRLVPRLRKAFPRSGVGVRMDASFATRELLHWCEVEGLTYYVSYARNPAICREAEPFQQEARLRAVAGKDAVVFGELSHKATTWSEERRVIVHADVANLDGRTPRDNPRFIVTNDVKRSPRGVYELYTARGDVENRYKELKDGLSFDRASCMLADANQFRYLLSVAAFMLFQHLRQAVDHPDLCRAQVTTLRERLIKLSVRVIETARRIVLKAPEAFGWITPWRHAALACSSARL
jgi:Transposase DDE domain group 1